MEKSKKILLYLKKVLPAVALAIGMTSVSQACTWWYHQPKVPEQMKKN